MKNTNFLLIVIIVLLVIVAGLIVGSQYNLFGKITNQTSQDENYEAIFLTNDQVYFGKIKGNEDGFVILEDIFYLRAGQALAEQNESTEKESQVQLIKFGNELHGPTDQMKINKEQILLIETLRSDSQIIKLIKNHKDNKSTELKEE